MLESCGKRKHEDEEDTVPPEDEDDDTTVRGVYYMILHVIQLF